ncbi:carbohydrate ABC transporter permease, partial [Nodosilinea sp. LEGE 07298]|nr:carbohydrate ABC transporter permease [Nodosilinea sp. LEGE 07298]
MLKWPHWRNAGIYALLLAIALVMVFPLLWLLSTSFKGPTENLLATPPQLLP